MIDTEFHRSLPESAVREALDYVGSRIVSGEYAVEGKLPLESDLENQLGSSRTVMRETSRLLTAKGMVRPVRHFGTAVRHHNNWNLLDTDIVYWHTYKSPTVDFIRLELDHLMGATLPNAVHRATTNIGENPLAIERTPQNRSELMALIFSHANSRMFQNLRDFALHYIRLYPQDKESALRDELFTRLRELVIAGRANEAKTCADTLMSM